MSLFGQYLYHDSIGIHLICFKKPSNLDFWFKEFLLKVRLNQGLN